MGTVGNSFDNAKAESVIGLYKNGFVKIDGPFKTVDELELATFVPGALVQGATSALSARLTHPG